MNFVVSQNGQLLNTNKFKWNNQTKFFESDEDNLTIDAPELLHITFKIGSWGTIKCGQNCTIVSRDNLLLDSNSNCIIVSQDNSILNIGSNCIVITGNNNTCIVGDECSLDLGQKSVVIRRDLLEVYTFDNNIKIKTNKFGKNGYQLY